MIDKQNGNNTDFNPLSWAILFFSFGYTLRILHNYAIFSLILFGMSIILLSSIYFDCLRNILNSSRAVKMILPTIFILTVAGFILGMLMALKNLSDVEQIIAVSFSFILLGTYVMVAISTLNKLAFRIIFCVIILILFLSRLAYSGFDLSWPLLIILVQGIWGTLTPNKFRNIPLV